MSEDTSHRPLGLLTTTVLVVGSMVGSAVARKILECLKLSARASPLEPASDIGRKSCVSAAVSSSATENKTHGTSSGSQPCGQFGLALGRNKESYRTVEAGSGFAAGSRGDGA